MREQLYKNFMNNKTIIALIIGAGTLLVATFGAAYAYFQVIANNNATATNTTGSLKSIGNVSLTTNTSKLYLNLDSVLMNQSNVGKKYYATTNSNGVPIENPTLNNGIYKLATASVASGATQYDCTYNYVIATTLTNPISDNSNANIKLIFKGDSIVFSEKSYTLKELINYNHLLSGTFKKVATGTPQTITVESYMENTNVKQDDFAGNSFTIKITPYGSSSGFSCVPYNTPYTKDAGKSLATTLINANNMWQTNLEGDGYRFAGPNPDNFVCFGTTNKTECVNNPGKYMYRAIGVFKDSSNIDHVKLIKYQTLPSLYAWHTTNTASANWADSSLKAGLNGSYFMTNTSYPYMQNTTWTNKITNWTWTTSNSKTEESGITYRGALVKNTYLHEMNKSTKTTSVGEWATTTSKVGLMYLNDYLLAYGESGINILLTTPSSNYPYFEAAWIHSNNNLYGATTGNYKYEWTMARYGLAGGSSYCIWSTVVNGSINAYSSSNTESVRPVFYLNNNVNYSSGIGTVSDPIILQ